MFISILYCKIYTFTEQYSFMYPINTILFLRRHFSERLLDSISFIVREADLSRQLMIVRYIIVRKCLFTQWTSPLSLDEDVLYIEVQSLHFYCRHAHYIDECTMVTEWSDSGWWKWVW